MTATTVDHSSTPTITATRSCIGAASFGIDPRQPPAVRPRQEIRSTLPIAGHPARVAF